MCFSYQKRHFCRDYSFLTVFLFTGAVTIPDNLAFKTTIIEDTHLTLAVIPFKVEANNSLIFLPLQTYEKNFSVPVKSIIPLVKSYTNSLFYFGHFFLCLAEAGLHAYQL